MENERYEINWVSFALCVLVAIAVFGFVGGMDAGTVFP